MEVRLNGRSLRSNISIQPFLKWAGGKRWLVSSYPRFFRLPFSGAYVEPFLGGGSVFASMEPEGAILSDINEELINLYQQICVNPQAMCDRLKELHRTHSTELYYHYRDLLPDEPFERAVRTLYLNRTCFNGIYRVNRQGVFNVPMGSKTAVVLPHDNFHAWSELLKSADLRVCDFQETIDQARPGDFVFADPPYTIRHNYNGFLKYNEVLFSWNDQERLSQCLSKAADRGVLIVATNANHADVRALYEERFRVEIVNRPSTVAARPINRGRYEEIVIHNLPSEDEDQ